MTTPPLMIRMIITILLIFAKPIDLKKILLVANCGCMAGEAHTRPGFRMVSKRDGKQVDG